jgi:hypothetical protein
MAFIVEDGTGLSNSNSYVDAAYVRDYHADRGNDEWAAINDNTKEQQLIRKAMDYINGTFGAAWQGYRTKLTQALDFPRRGIHLGNNRVSAGFAGNGYFVGGMPGYGAGQGFYGTYDYLDAHTIPTELKDAVAELALIAKSTPLSPTQKQAKKRVKVGPLEVEYDSASPQANRFIGATAKLAIFIGGISSSGGMVRLNRA